MIHTVLPMLPREQESGLDLPWFIVTEHADDTIERLAKARKEPVATSSRSNATTPPARGRGHRIVETGTHRHAINESRKAGAGALSSSHAVLPDGRGRSSTTAQRPKRDSGSFQVEP